MWHRLMQRLDASLEQAWSKERQRVTQARCRSTAMGLDEPAGSQAERGGGGSCQVLQPCCDGCACPGVGLCVPGGPDAGEPFSLEPLWG